MSSHLLAESSLRFAQLPLIGPNDPAPFTLFNETGNAPVLLIADHASNAIPEAMDHLGLGQEALSRHIAYDIGIAWLVRRLAMLLDAPALLHGYSRLLIDPNRHPADPTSICTIGDGVVVPGNRELAADAAAQRAAAFFHPYHRAVEATIMQFLESGTTPALISLHSFTPQIRSFVRPWHVGILWDEIDGRIPLPLLEKLNEDPSLCVGDNQPYTGRGRHGYTVETHAMARGLPNVLIEVRQDLIADRVCSEQWADRLAAPLQEILADPSTFLQENA